MALLSILVFAWCAWLIIMGFMAQLDAGHPFDFEAYYAAAESLRFDSHASIYSVATLIHTAHQYGECVPYAPLAYVYPPLLAILLEPLTLLPCGSASVIWLVVNAVLWAGATWLLALVVAGRWPGHRLLAITLTSLLSFCFVQAYGGLFLGQAHIVLLFMLALAMWLAERNYPWLTGASLALGAAIKFFPAGIVLYFLLRRRFRVVGGAMLAGGCLILLMLAATSATTLFASPRAAFISVTDQTGPGLNESLVVTLPHFGSLVAMLAAAIFLVVVAMRRGDDLPGIGWTLCTVVLMSPIVWSFYLVWLMPAFCACLATLGPQRRYDARMQASRMTLVLLYVVIAFPLWQPLRPFATLALWGLMGALYWQSGVGASVESAPAPAVAVGQRL
ncbi:MAG TPA: glycosyltransferase family 87 protein [Ktedonobacterales bacterium]